MEKKGKDIFADILNDCDSHLDRANEADTAALLADLKAEHGIDVGPSVVWPGGQP